MAMQELTIMRRLEVAAVHGGDLGFQRRRAPHMVHGQHGEHDADHREDDHPGHVADRRNDESAPRVSNTLGGLEPLNHHLVARVTGQTPDQHRARLERDIEPSRIPADGHCGRQIAPLVLRTAASSVTSMLVSPLP